MIKTIIIDLAGLFMIASCVYDMYVNYHADKFNQEMRETNKELEKQIKQIKEPISIKILRDVLKKYGEEPVFDPDTKEYLGSVKIQS